ncbi:uncharacterized protein [Lepisosteus oculatus]|uniref:uncharacterized protein n=1 Tax=Lepisosteus oculatus TaxID=7918 RepID=UPI0007403DE6|nr:PREDICTED: uncharacterized protein LOC107076132 [Lepisosteus oculatus]
MRLPAISLLVAAVCLGVQSADPSQFLPLPLRTLRYRNVDSAPPPLPVDAPGLLASRLEGDSRRQAGEPYNVNSFGLRFGKKRDTQISWISSGLRSGGKRGRPERGEA